MKIGIKYMHVLLNVIMLCYLNTNSFNIKKIIISPFNELFHGPVLQCLMNLFICQWADPNTWLVTLLIKSRQIDSRILIDAIKQNFSGNRQKTSGMLGPLLAPMFIQCARCRMKYQKLHQKVHGDPPST